jgi:hypothetical protein
VPLTHQAWRPLPDALDAGGALAAALAPAPDSGPGAAARAVSAVLAAAALPAVAPLFGGADGADWRRAQPADGAEATLLAELAAGRREVVVTGQQPGFLGGPLLTLHKVATAIALAAARSAGGRPTVAVFWCGDDDDDLVEALDPVGWDPAAAALVRADGRPAARAGRQERGLIGPLPARRWCRPGAALLERLAARGGDDALGAELAALWRRALAEDWDWSRLNVAALRRVFAGYPLLVVRGNDPLLHAAGAAFYAGLAGRRAELRGLVAAEGARVTAAGGVAALSERSLRRHLYTEVGGRREALPEDAALPEPASLRPGVLLRSPLQDWLLRPVAVVAGPGEFAYLRELSPLYAALGVPRAPLVPRLFAWLLPDGFDPAPLATRSATGEDDGARAEATASALAARAQAELARALREDLGLPAARAGELAQGRARRWARGVAALLRQEAARARQAPLATVPPWVLPEGRRQERRLAAAAAAGLLGDGLPGALVAAAAAHLAAGAGQDWREYLVRNA